MTGPEIRCQPNGRRVFLTGSTPPTDSTAVRAGGPTKPEGTRSVRNRETFRTHPPSRYRPTGCSTRVSAVIYRFCAGLVLVVLISLAGTALEKETLALRREVTRQSYRQTILEERLARLTMELQTTGAPARHLELAERLRREATEAAAKPKPRPPSKSSSRKARPRN
jgi:hypothetical protein